MITVAWLAGWSALTIAIKRVNDWRVERGGGGLDPDWGESSGQDWFSAGGTALLVLALVFGIVWAIVGGTPYDAGP